MTNFNLDKKKEHEALAEKCIRGKDYAGAFMHVAKAAKFAYILADRCAGAMRAAYEENGNDLVDIAARLKEMAAADAAAPSRHQSEQRVVSHRTERPTARLADVAGMDAVKEQLRLRMVEPVRHAEEARRHGLKVGGGILLYGPPGTGKTFLAKAVAGELDIPFYSITPADVFGKYVGESEGNIRALFAEARANPLSVVFIDELESIFRKRTESVHETTQKVISVMLQELDGVTEGKNPVMLLGATNTPWMIDEAFMRAGRFDVLAYVGLPDVSARRKIAENSFKDVKYPVDSDGMELLVGQTEGFSGADINGIVQRVKQIAFDDKAERYTKALFEKALKGARPSCNAEIAAKIAEWEKENDIHR